MKAFVIRLWTPTDEVEAHSHAVPELRGVVEPVGSQEATPFKDGTELLGLLRERLLQARGAPGLGEGRQ